MAARARRREFHRSHPFASAWSGWTPERSSICCEHQIFVRVSYAGRSIPCVRVFPLRRSNRRLVAIPALQLYVRPIWPTTYRFHVDGVIDHDRSGIPRDCFIRGVQRREFRMPVFKALNMRRVTRRAVARFQIPVALRATLILRCHEVHSSAMFRVALRAANRFRLRRVMQRPVMARQTGPIAGFRRKRSRRMHMARRALRLQHRVRLAHSTAGIHARITRESVPCNPNQRDRR